MTIDLKDTEVRLIKKMLRKEHDKTTSIPKMVKILDLQNKLK
jgi:hypothetical protein